MNKTWIEGLNEIAAGMLFNGGYVVAPGPRTAKHNPGEECAEHTPADARSASPVGQLVRTLRPLPR